MLAEEELPAKYMNMHERANNTQYRTAHAFHMHVHVTECRTHPRPLVNVLKLYGVDNDDSPL